MIEPLEIRNCVASKLKELGVSEWIAVVRRDDRTMVKFANNVVTVVQQWSRTSLELFIAKDGRVAHSQAFVETLDDCAKLVASVYESLERSSPSPLYAPVPQPNGKPLPGTVDERVRSDREDLVKSVTNLIDSAIRAGAERVAGTLELGYIERYVYTSRGFEGVQPITFVKAYARAFRGEVSGHWAWGSTRFDQGAIEEVGRLAGEYAATNLPFMDVEPGEYQAILSPLVVGNLVNNLALMASAMMVIMGASMFAKVKPGEKVFSDELTIIDAPLETELPNASGFDDEGIQCFNKPIVEKGVFKTLLHNSRTAKMMNASSTGNAGLFNPVPWNIIVEPGRESLDSLIKEVRRGFLVLNNWYTRMQNWVEGMFSTVTRDALIYIEGGEPKALCRKLRIADTFRRVFSSVKAATKDSYSVWWWEVEVPTKAPYILVEKARFTKPEV